MAKKPEAVFSDYISAHLPDADISRIESLANLGFPDMSIADKLTGRIAYLENKVVSRGLQVKMRPHQVSFAVRHWSYGVPVFILIKHVLPGKRSGSVYLYPGAVADQLLLSGLRVAPLDTFPFPMALDNWQRLRHHLFESRFQ